jgi:hypothetical protein
MPLIYSNAFTKAPNNEEVGNKWFMALVKKNLFKDQQAVNIINLE